MANEVDALIQDLRSGGELDAQGGFTLDPQKAREKLRQFQLADPRSYVLLLVSAAVLSGATRIDFRIDADDLHVRFDGVFTAADMDALYTSLFGAKDDPSARPRQELALALNAAMALEPAFARIESADASGVGVRSTIRPDLPDEIETEVQGLSPGTVVHIKDRFRTRNIVRFLQRFRGTIDEAVYLRERCRYSSIPITLDGRTISEGPHVPDALAQTEVAVPGGRALVAWIEVGQPATIDLLVGGVWIAQHQLDRFPFLHGFRVIVETTALRKDVSQGDVVRDATYDALYTQLYDGAYAVLQELLPRLVGRDGGIRAAPNWVIDLVVAYVEAFGQAVLASDTPFTKMLAWLPLWPTLDGSTRTTEGLARVDGPLGFVETRFDEGVPPGHEHVVVLSELRWKNAFRSVFGTRAENHTAVLEQALLDERARRAFLARRHPPRVGTTSCRLRRTFRHDADGETGAIEGEGALLEDRSSAARFVLVKDGCALWELSTPDIAIPGLVVVVQAEFRPADGYRRAFRDATLARALLAACDVVHELMHELATGLATDERERARRFDLLSHVTACLDGGLEQSVLSVFGFDMAQIHQTLARHDVHPRAPRLSNEIGDRAWAHVPLFGTADGRIVSAVEIDLAAPASIFVVSLKNPQAIDLPHLVLRAAEREITLLETVFGTRRIVRWDGVYQRLLQRRARNARPRDLLVPRDACVSGPAHFDFGDARVAIGLVGDGDRKPGVAKIRVLTDHRDVCDIELPCPIEGICVALDVDELETNTEWSALRGRAARQRVAVLMAKAIARFVGELVDRESMTASERLALLDAACAPLVGKSWAGARRLLAEHRDEAGVCEELGELFGLVDAVGGDLVDDVLRQLVSAGTLPSSRRVQEQLARRREVRELPQVSLAHLRRRLLELAPKIENLPLVRTLSGETSLVGLAREVEQHAKVPWIAADGAPGTESPGRMVLWLTRAEHARVERFLGPDALEDGAVWLEQWRRRRAFEQVPELAALALGSDDALVSVAVDEDRLEGELGLPLARPEDATTSILVCRGRRPIGRVSLSLPVPLVGIVGGDALGGRSGVPSLNGADEDRITRLCQRRLRTIWQALAGIYDTLEGHRRSLADAWVHHAFFIGAKGTRARPGRLQGGIDVLARLPVLETLGSSRASFEDVRSAHPDGPVPVATGHHPPVDDLLVVLLRSAQERRVLEEVFGELRDYDSVVAERNRAADRKAAAPRLPEPPSRALVVEEVSGRGLSGKLWIDPRTIGEASIAFGREGQVASTQTVSELLACSGAFEGPAVEVSDDWSSVELGWRARELLLRKIVGMYDELADSYLESLTGEQPESPSLGQRLRQLVTSSDETGAARSVLRRALIRMHAEVRSGRVWSSERHRKLYRKLCELPLLPLHDGRNISLDVAMRERPMTLAELELWDGGSSASRDEVGLGALGRLLGGALEQVRPPERSESPTTVVASNPRPEPDRSRSRSSESKPVPSLPVQSPARLTPPEPSPELRLLDAIRAELRLVRAGNLELLDDAHLDMLRCGVTTSSAAVHEQDGAIVLNSRHPVVLRALAELDGDPMWVSFLASSVYSTLNHWLAEVTDPDELAFHRLHALHLASGLEST